MRQKVVSQCAILAGVFLLGKVIECVSQINTGAKYNDDVFQFSVGLNGVGTKAVNALSSHFLCAAIAMANLWKPFFPRELKDKKKGKTKEPNGTYVEFIPDPEIFKKFHFQKEFILKAHLALCLSEYRA